MIQVSTAASTPAPSSVAINVFDGYGRIGHADIAPARLPGSITLRGLPDSATELRVVAIGMTSAAPLLGGARLRVQPGQRVTATIALSRDTPDGDADLVPDALDDCPASDDPLQENAAGSGPGDACRGTVVGGDDLAGPATGDDLAGAAGGDDLATLVGAPDLATAPDLGVVASMCATAGVAFCDGFESTTLSSHWSTNVANGGSISVHTTRAYRGASSLKIHNNALAANTWSDVELLETQTFPSTHFFMRAFVYIPSGFPADEADIFLAEQAVSPWRGIIMASKGTSFLTSNSIANSTKTSTTTMPRNQWVCLEWEVQTGSSGSTVLSVNGQMANGLGGTQNLSSNPPIAEAGFILAADATGTPGIAARDVWFDEVIIDTQAIGCTK